MRGRSRSNVSGPSRSWARFSVFAWVLALAAGCGSSTPSGASGPDGGDASATTYPDAGGGYAPEDAPSTGDEADGDIETGTPDLDGGSGGDATTYFITPVQLQGPCTGSACLCLPQTLPVDATGQVPCEVYFELESGDSGDVGDAGDAGDVCALYGLADAASDVTLSITAAQGGTLPGPLCLLPQLPTTEWVDGSCGTSSEAGWCYVTGAAAGSCSQSLRVSPTGFPPAGALALLACGETPPDAGFAQETAASSVGTPCIPSLELSASFGGFRYADVTVDEDNPACPGAVCLVNHFQGLTSCPYGQDSEGNPANGASLDCSVPGTTTPVRPDAPVGGETVQPWCVDRSASDTVTCSCRCQNVEGQTNDGATYCTCPSGYSCTQVVPATESGDPRAGAYCIPDGTAYAASGVCLATCNVATDPCP
jgi:hypothetical protein